MELSYPRITPEEASIAEINLRVAGWATEEMQDFRECRIWSKEEREQRKILPNQQFPPSELSCRYFVSLFTTELLSLHFVIWFYGSGAAHGNTRFKPLNLLLNPPTSLHLGSFFKSGTNYLEVLAKLCREALLLQPGADSWFVNSGTTAEYKNFENFTVTREGLCFLFPPYQVGPFSWGPREVLLSFGSLTRSLTQMARCTLRI